MQNKMREVSYLGQKYLMLKLTHLVKCMIHIVQMWPHQSL